MVGKDFKINKKTFRKRKLSTLQHKLRVLMKCYTVVNFDLDEETQSFTFKKTYRINGIKMDDPKDYCGRFEIKDLDEDNINLRIIVGEKKKDANE